MTWKKEEDFFCLLETKKTWEIDLIMNLVWSCFEQITEKKCESCVCEDIKKLMFFLLGIKIKLCSLKNKVHIL